MWCPDLYKSKPQIMKTAIGRPLFIIFIIALLSNKKLQAQTWSTTGNSGLTTSNFLGTTDNKALIFKIKNIERGRLLTNGTWRFGTAVKYVAIDSTGNINSTSLAGVGFRPLYADSAGNITTNAMKEILEMAAKHGIEAAPLFNDHVLELVKEKVYV